MTQELVITRAGAADVAELAVLFTELNRTVGIVGVDAEHHRLPANTDVSETVMAARLRAVDGVETVLLGRMGEAAGFTSVRVIPYLDQDTPYAEVTQLYVRPQFRRQGIASRLMTAAEEMARGAGATCLHVQTGSGNTNAQAFYRACGYEVGTYDFQKFFEGRPADA